MRFRVLCVNIAMSYVNQVMSVILCCSMGKIQEPFTSGSDEILIN